MMMEKEWKDICPAGQKHKSVSERCPRGSPVSEPLNEVENLIKEEF